MEQQQGISRRSMIKGSVVAGGLVWAAPTLMSAASASHGSHCAVNCQNYCRVKVDPTGPGGSYVGGACESNPESGGFQCLTTIPGTPVTNCCGTGKFTVTGTASTQVTVTVTDPLCKLLSASVKQGNLPGGCGTMTVSGNCDSATWTGDSSHVEFIICCQTS